MEHELVGENRVPTSDELAYVEEVGFYFEQAGLPRMAGRILGWLLICDPPHQTAADLAAVLRASKGSISTATRQLVTARLIERLALPGERRDYFRVRPDGWAERMRWSIAALTDFRRLTQRGLDLVGDVDPRRRERLEAIDDFYAWLEREWPALFARWEQEYRARKDGPV